MIPPPVRSALAWVLPRQPPSAAASILPYREVPATPGRGTWLASPTPTPLGFIYCTNISYFHVLCHSASRHSQDVGTEPYFIFYICKSHFILYLYRAKKTYLFSDLQYVSYPTPLYFVDFTNKASCFFFPQQECVWSFLNLGQSHVRFSVSLWLCCRTCSRMCPKKMGWGIAHGFLGQNQIYSL